MPRSNASTAENPMTFAEQLQAAKGHLSDTQAAKAVSHLLPAATVEAWLAGENEPPLWSHKFILGKCVQAKTRARCRIAWEKADWSRTNDEIAKDLGTNPSYVSSMRGAVTQKVAAPKWAGVDWSRKDADLAKERGVSRQAVNTARKRHQKKEEDKA